MGVIDKSILDSAPRENKTRGTIDIMTDITYIVRPNTNKPAKIITAGFNFPSDDGLPDFETCQEIIAEIDCFLSVLKD